MELFLTALLILVFGALTLFFVRKLSKVGQKIQTQYSLSCSKCGHVFKPFTWFEGKGEVPRFFWGPKAAFNAMLQRKFGSYARCPKCGKFSRCSWVENTNESNK